MIDSFWPDGEAVYYDEVSVCTRHNRFLPCRPCGRIEDGGRWDSTHPDDIEIVREHMRKNE